MTTSTAKRAGRDVNRKDLKFSPLSLFAAYDGAETGTQPPHGPASTANQSLLNREIVNRPNGPSLCAAKTKAQRFGRMLQEFGSTALPASAPTYSWA